MTTLRYTIRRKYHEYHEHVKSEDATCNVRSWMVCPLQENLNPNALFCILVTASRAINHKLHGSKKPHPNPRSQNCVSSNGLFDLIKLFSKCVNRLQQCLCGIAFSRCIVSPNALPPPIALTPHSEFPKLPRDEMETRFPSRADEWSICL